VRGVEGRGRARGGFASDPDWVSARGGVEGNGFGIDPDWLSAGEGVLGKGGRIEPDWLSAKEVRGIEPERLRLREEA
jgi:hypothetical protein